MTTSATTNQSEFCAKCGAAGAGCTVWIDGTRKGRRETWCTECWNAQARSQREAHAASLAQRPRCEACGKRPATWNVGADKVGMCGWCKRASEREAASAVARGGAPAIMVSMFGGWTPGSEELIGFACGEAQQ